MNKKTRKMHYKCLIVKCIAIAILLVTSCQTYATNPLRDLLLSSYGCYTEFGDGSDNDAKAISNLGFKYVIYYTHDNVSSTVSSEITHYRNNNIDVIVQINTKEQANILCPILSNHSNVIGWYIKDEVDRIKCSIQDQDELITTIKQYSSKAIFGSACSNYFPFNVLSDRYDYIFISNYLNESYDSNHTVENKSYLLTEYISPHASIGGQFGLDKCIPVYGAYRLTNSSNLPLTANQLSTIWEKKYELYGKPGAFFIYNAGKTQGEDTMIMSTMKNSTLLKEAARNFIQINRPVNLGLLFAKSLTSYIDAKQDKNLIYSDFFNNNPSVSYTSNGVLINNSQTLIFDFTQKMSAIQLFMYYQQTYKDYDQWFIGKWNSSTRNFVVRKGNKIFMDKNWDGLIDYSFSFGNGNLEDQYLIGDWDGDGISNIAVRRGNRFYMDLNFDGNYEKYFEYGNGNSEDEYLVGDWNGDGVSNIAVRRGHEILMDINFDGNYEKYLAFGNGNSEDEYLVGDWDGDGISNIAVRRGLEILMDLNFDGNYEKYQAFGNGNSEDEYLVGDWDGDGISNIAIRKGNTIEMDTNFDGVRDIIKTISLLPGTFTLYKAADVTLPYKYIKIKDITMNSSEYFSTQVTDFNSRYLIVKSNTDNILNNNIFIKYFGCTGVSNAQNSLNEITPNFPVQSNSSSTYTTNSINISRDINKDLINISIKNLDILEPTTLQIFDLSGVLIKSQDYINNYNNSIQINTSTIKNGIYLIKITNSNKAYTEKIIINKHH